VMCAKHGVPMNKRYTIKEGESRYFCVKCLSEEKKEVNKDARISIKE